MHRLSMTSEGNRVGRDIVMCCEMEGVMYRSSQVQLWRLEDLNDLNHKRNVKNKREKSLMCIIYCCCCKVLQQYRFLTFEEELF